jgi:hypothetical protein
MQFNLLLLRQRFALFAPRTSKTKTLMAAPMRMRRSGARETATKVRKQQT